MHITIPSSALFDTYLHGNRAVYEDLHELRPKHALLFTIGRFFNYIDRIIILALAVSVLFLPAATITDMNSGLRHFLSWSLFSSLILSVVSWRVDEKALSVKYKNTSRPNVSLVAYEALRQQFAEIIGESVSSVDSYDGKQLFELGTSKLIELSSEIKAKRDAGLDDTEEFDVFDRAHTTISELRLVSRDSWISFVKQRHGDFVVNK